ncbi:hypothetical protein WR25_25980 [Diploscapter pachys]|uniref:Uncharacterized protein n=1 Tax=Diploscapter pachys TaxID=2018661 RepID=A0A2A2M4H9_9BILA|nr:hypothetical protein WR25_25980 [Diploscapter pachys]
MRQRFGPRGDSRQHQPLDMIGQDEAEIGTLRRGKQHVCAEWPQPPVPPACQCLDPGDTPRIDSRLRLEQDVDLVALDRKMQVDGERIDRRRVLGSGDANRRPVAGLRRHQCLRGTVEQAGGIIARCALRQAPATAQHRLSPPHRNRTRQGAIKGTCEADQRALLRHRRNDDIAAARRADHRIVAQQLGGHRTNLPMRLGDQRVAHRTTSCGIQDIEPRQPKSAR